MVALNYGRIDAIPADSMNRVTESGLVRGIGRWDFLGFAINASIGAGIFGLPGRIYALTGMYSLLAFFVSAALMILIILCFVEVAGRFRETGGPYLYARETFGPFIGFQVGWLLWLTRMAGFAAISHLFVNYVGYFWPAASSGATRISIIAALVVGLTTINYIGVRAGRSRERFLHRGEGDSTAALCRSRRVLHRQAATVVRSTARLRLFLRRRSPTRVHVHGIRGNVDPVGGD
jgi:hypothetical protein